MEPESTPERDNIPPLVEFTINPVMVMADSFEPDIEISEEV